MKTAEKLRVCLTPQVHGVGGMVSFAARLSAGLAARGIQVTHDLRQVYQEQHSDQRQAVLVIGGTRDLAGLWRAGRRSIAIVQRLNGMNWVHRRRRTGLKHYLRAEYGNLILSLIRARLATRIVYQSQFTQQWWERVYGPTRSPWQIIYNAVDLEVYKPQGEQRAIKDEKCRILMVEGNLGGGYEMGLTAGIQLAERLAGGYPEATPAGVELMVVGKVAEALRQEWDRKLAGAAGRVTLHWAGQVAREQIPALAGAAHLFYAADLHPACPNAVIEALACGLPVIASDTGALAEIVSPGAGRVVPYGADSWKIEPPDTSALARAAAEALADLPRFRAGARARAEEAFGLDRMVEAYLAALFG